MYMYYIYLLLSNIVYYISELIKIVIYI